MCWTRNTLAARSTGSIGRTFSKVAGPPVEMPSATATGPEAFRVATGFGRGGGAMARWPPPRRTRSKTPEDAAALTLDTSSAATLPI